MKRFRIPIALVVMAACAALSFAGGAKEAPAPAKAQPQPQGPVTIKVWVQADAVRYPGFEKVTNDFMAANPNVKVEMTNIPGSWEELYQKLIAGYVSKTWPDVLFAKGYTLVDFAARGMLYNLTPFWNRDKVKDLNASEVFFKHVEEGSSYNGKVYGLPRGQYWYALAYNLDLFKAAGIANPPSNWEEFRQAAVKTTNKAKDVWGFAMATYIRIDPVFVESALDIWTKQAGGSIMDFKPDGSPVYKLDGNPQAVEALQFIVDNIYKYECFLPPDKDASRDTMSYNNQLAMWWSHGGFISRYLKAAPKLNYRIASMPGKTNKTSYITDNKFLVSGSTKFPEQAWEYIKYFTSKEGEATFAPFEGHISVWKSNWNIPAYSHPGYKGLMEQLVLKDTQPFQFHAGWVPVRNAIAREIQQVIFKKVSVEDGLAAAQKAADKELAQLK